MPELSDEKIQNLTDKVKNQMEKMGIKVVDATIYSAYGGRAFNSRVVGYMAGKAAVFIGKIDDSGNMVFVINYQMKEGTKIYVDGEYFPGLKKNPAGQDGSRTSTRCDVFDFKDEDDRIREGIDFFKSFLDLYGGYLQEKFTKRVLIDVVSYYSDEYKDLEKIKGFDKANDTLREKIEEKFPEGFLIRRSIEG